jgi:BirA family biotin operon repressor/biotin-[acetyl-CoA-carboxylase] ligase
MDPGTLNFELVKPGLLSELVYLEETDSTNEYASTHKLHSDTLVVTSNQTNGKGRFGRKWMSSPGKNVAMTLVKNFPIDIDKIHNVSFYSSLVLIRSLKKICDGYETEFSLKWPNDLLLNGKKVAGFLLDTKDLRSNEKRISIGVGINVNEQNFDEDIIHKATSLLQETGNEFMAEDIIVNYVKDFFSDLQLLNDSNSLMTEWKSYCSHIGMNVKFRLLADSEEKNAFVKDILQDGSLRLLTEDGSERSFFSGEISLGFKN